MKLSAISRSIRVFLLFQIFFAGAAVLSFIILPFVRDKRKGLNIVRGTWRGARWLFIKFGIITVEPMTEHHCRGSVIVANHPSLIDVVLLTCYLPDTFSVAKHQLLHHPFMGRIVRNVFLPDNETLLDEGKKLLDEGYNLLIFPEGTRTPLGENLGKLKRGAAQLALRLDKPLVPIKISVSKRILAKEQNPFWGETSLVRYAFTPFDAIPAPDAISTHIKAKRLTSTLESLLN